MRAWNDQNTKDRENGKYYREHFKMAHTAKVRFKLFKNTITAKSFSKKKFVLIYKNTRHPFFVVIRVI